MTRRVLWNGHFRRGRDANAMTRLCVALHKVGQCPHCGLRPAVTEGGTTTRLDPPCPNPAGLTRQVIEVDVPSGLIAVANDLRPLFPDAWADANANLPAGRRAITAAYAEAGMAHAYVGNSRPALVQAGRFAYYIGGNHRGLWNVLTHIPTDLWWFSLADHAECLRRAAVLDVDLDALCSFVLGVEPGRYRVVHDEGRGRAYEPRARISRVGAAEPSGDHLERFLALYEPPGRIVPEFLRREGFDWATVEDRRRALAVAADTLLVVIGSDERWHPRGWPLVRVPDDDPCVDLPGLAGMEPFPWYPLCDSSPLLAERLAPDWTRLALEVLQHMVDTGLPLEENRERAGRSLALARRSIPLLRSRLDPPPVG